MNAPNENTQLMTLGDGMSAMTMLSDQGAMDRMVKFAEIMATGKATIPQELRNVGDCLAITMQAMNWKMNPFSVAQKTHFISGKIGYEAQLVAAAIVNSGAIVGNFGFEWYGPWEKVIGKFEVRKGEKGEYRVPGWKLADEEGIGIKVWATLRNETTPRVLDLLLAQARTRNSTLWADDPRQQLAYLAQKRWARLYAPGVILGVYTPDELAEPAERYMGTAEVVTGDAVTGEAKKFPAYTDQQMAENMPRWAKRIAAKKATADEIIATVESKYDLTDAQKQQIRDLEKPQAAPSSPAEQTSAPADPPSDAAPGVTFEGVANAIARSQSFDTLDVAADLIGEIADASEREELGKRYKARRAELGG